MTNRDPEAFAVLRDLLLQRWPPEFHGLLDGEWWAVENSPALNALWALWDLGPGRERTIIDLAGLAPVHGPPDDPERMATHIRLHISAETLRGVLQTTEGVVSRRAAAQLGRRAREANRGIASFGVQMRRLAEALRDIGPIRLPEEP